MQRDGKARLALEVRAVSTCCLTLLWTASGVNRVRPHVELGAPRLRTWHAGPLFLSLRKRCYWALDYRLLYELREEANTAKTAIALGLALAGLTALAVLGVFSAGNKPGFLTPNLFVADFNLALQVLLVLGLTVGAWLARRGRIEAHRVNQTIWVLVNGALVLFMMALSMTDVKVTSIADLKDMRTAVTWAHAIVGTLTFIAGIWLVLQMNDILPARFHITWWKKLMRLTLAGYWAVALGGLVTYYYWYY